MKQGIGILAVRALAAAARRPRVRLALQVAAVAVLLVSLAYGVRGSWRDAGERLRSADPAALALGLVLIAAYYLAFTVGWRMILRAMGVRLGYRDSLRSEMLSLLAKYVPGGVWTPAARVIAVRRLGVTDTPLVLGSIALEAGLSAIAGVLVFAAGMTTVSSTDTPIGWLIGFAVAAAVLLHPRVFQPATRAILRPFGGGSVPQLSQGTMLLLVGYYCLTWLLAGAGLFFVVASVGDPSPSAVLYLGGTSAVGAIVAVLVFVSPSGLGVREGATYTLLLAVVSPAAALGAVVVNRLAITLVEVLLLVVVGVAPRGTPDDTQQELAENPAPSTAQA